MTASPLAAPLSPDVLTCSESAVHGGKASDDAGDTESTIAPDSSSTGLRRSQRQGAMKHKKELEMQALRQQVLDLQERLNDEIHVENELRNQVRDFADTWEELRRLKEKRAQDKLRNMVVLGRIQEERRQFGFTSDDDFSAFVGSDPSEASVASSGAPFEESEESVEGSNANEDTSECSDVAFERSESSSQMTNP